MLSASSISAQARAASPDSLYRWGQLHDQNGPLPHMPLHFKRLKMTVTTDAAGEFHLVVPMRRALRVSRDVIILKQSSLGLQELEVELFEAGPIDFRALTLSEQPSFGPLKEDNIEDVLGKDWRTQRQQEQQRKQKKP
ncbi:hypothetical protein D0N36_11750 [Hymenobacter lapidiphilus]|nr:hypothetical protein D0N36_11750 [Hymenobacter sp. CCM 8763]